MTVVAPANSLSIHQVLLAPLQVGAIIFKFELLPCNEDS